MRALILAAFALLSLALAGCLGLVEDDSLEPAATTLLDSPFVLPSDAYYDAAFVEGVGYHTLDETQARIGALAAAYPDLARVETLGKTNEGREIRAIVIDTPARAGQKPVAFYDGGHHANEVEGIETLLYLADFLLANYEGNATIREHVDGVEIWIVPLVNADGYVVQTRTNANGVNLNRNYEIAWCEAGNFHTCLPDPAGPYGPEYAGPAPFSEPEARAVRDAILGLRDRLAFYLTQHTDLHCVFSPWVAREGPFPIPEAHQAVFDAVFAYTVEHTEFGAGDAAWGTGECVAYNHGGGSMDWVYVAAGVPTFTMETGGNEAREGLGNFLSAGGLSYEQDIAHWGEATLPLQLLLLENAARLKAWDPGLVAPVLRGAHGMP